MSNRVIVFAGWPGRVGGAGTESFETQRFLIRQGLEVHCFPTWEAPEPSRRAEVEALGVNVHLIKPHEITPWLRELGDPPVVTFINEKVLPHARRWRDTSRWIHLPCMTYLHSWEKVAFQNAGVPDAFVLQSDYQRQRYLHGLKRHQYRDENLHSIRGAFCWEEWAFRVLPREPQTPFRICRIARPDVAKWSSDLFPVLDAVPNVQAILLGLTEPAKRNLGRRRWAQMLAPGQRPVVDVLSECHAQVAMNNSAKENWPRIGLESMAAGVPLVVDGRWGWTEMVRDGETGFLCKRPDEFRAALQALEADENLRLRIAQQARESLERDLANPAVIWAGWQAMFRTLGLTHLADTPADPPPAPDFQRFFYPEKPDDQDSVQRTAAGDLPDHADPRLPGVVSRDRDNATDELRLPDEPPRCDSGEIPAGVLDLSQDAAEPAPQAARWSAAEEIPPTEETPQGDAGRDISRLPADPAGPAEHECWIEVRNDLGPDIEGVALEHSRPVGINTEPVTPSDLGLPDEIDGTSVEIHRGAPIMPPDPESSGETDDVNEQVPTTSRRRRKKRRRSVSSPDTIQQPTADQHHDPQPSR